METPRFTAKVIENVQTQPGCWNHQRIGVFDGEQQIGEYIRNYSSFAQTFYAFEQRGKWFALYSPHYTGTRIMSLPDCRDLGGEDKNSGGFCPVELFVPRIAAIDGKTEDPEPMGNPRRDIDRFTVKQPHPNGGVTYLWPRDEGGKKELLETYNAECEDFDARHKAWMARNPFVTRYADFGFVSGCHWGDDTSWKIQLLDLKDASQGVIKREDRFGYLPLPRGVSLEDAVDVHTERFDWPPNMWRVWIATARCYDLAGKLLDKEELTYYQELVSAGLYVLEFPAVVDNTIRLRMYNAIAGLMKVCELTDNQMERWQEIQKIKPDL